MKILLLLSLLISSTVYSRDLQVCTFAFTGDMPSPFELSRMIELDQIEPSQELYVPVSDDGSFSYNEKQTVNYPIEFDDDGNVMKSKNRDLGKNFSGTIDITEQHTEISISYSNNSFAGTNIYSLKNGIAVAAPTFHIHKFKSTLTSSNAREWTFFGLYPWEDGNFKVVAVRLKDNSAQQGAAVNP